MSAYQWKLTIIERNLSLSNWLDLLPEAQERTLEEAEELIEDLLPLDKQRLIASLEKLQDCAEEAAEQKIQQILYAQSNFSKVTELRHSALSAVPDRGNEFNSKGDRAMFLMGMR
jgi:hypothetical protein